MAKKAKEEKDFNINKQDKDSLSLGNIDEEKIVQELVDHGSSS